MVDVVQDGLLDLDEPAGPEGSTIRHLLAHTSGLAFDEDRIVAVPGAKRVYSNVGIDLVTEIAAGRAGLRHGRALIEQRVLTPLGMADTVINGPASHGAAGSTFDLARLADELLSPRVLRPEVIDTCATPQFPGLSGVLPGFGRQADNLWGLGCELRGTKDPHWLPASADPASFGHFGQSGSFLWVDRSAGLAVVAATGTAFGPWAAQAWPRDLGRWLESWGRVPVAARQWELVS